MNIDSFKAYQIESRKTWGVIDMNHPIAYPTLGLVNEAGEVAGKVKKIFRDRNGRITPEDRLALKKRAGGCTLVSDSNLHRARLITRRGCRSKYREIVFPFRARHHSR